MNHKSRNPYVNAGKPAEKCSLDSDNPVKMAMMYFGKRLEVKGGIWLLDKQPMSLNDVMKRYNAIRRRFKQPQVSNNPNWWV